MREGIIITSAIAYTYLPGPTNTSHVLIHPWEPIHLWALALYYVLNTLAESAQPS